MSLPSLPAEHLSDEAVVAFADGALSKGARERAARHVARCPECAHAVAVQREAVWALRAAPAPALPGSLLQRLRAVPATTPLREPPAGLGPDGSAVFPAFGTHADEPDSEAPTQRAEMRAGRRSRPYGLLTAAAAVVALSTAGIALASSGGSGSGQQPTQLAPSAPVSARVQPALNDVGPQMFLRPAARSARVGSTHR